MKRGRLTCLLVVIASVMMAFAMTGCSSMIEELKAEPYIVLKGDKAFNLCCSSITPNWNGRVEFYNGSDSWNEWLGDEISSFESKGSHCIYLRGVGNTHFSYATQSTTFEISGDATEVECIGNILMLLDYNNPYSVEMDAYCFKDLFLGCSVLTKAPELPSTKLSVACYERMFANCTSLGKSPELPATKLRVLCYDQMFLGCTALSDVGKISAVDIDADYAMSGMFQNCSSLKVIETSVERSALISIKTVTGQDAVDSMFSNCNPLGVSSVKAGKFYKVLASFNPTSYLTFQGNGAFKLGTYYDYDEEYDEEDEGDSYRIWDGQVYYSTDKTTWKMWDVDGHDEISSSEVKDGKAFVYLAGKDNTAFSYFYQDDDGYSFDITVLTLSGDATEVECTGNIMSLLDGENPDEAEMGEYCFKSLFEECDKLTVAPSLPAEKLSYGCYEDMFSECISLVKAPDLPAKTLAESCYYGMFGECTSLVKPPVISATTVAENSCEAMFSECTSLVDAPALNAEVLADSCYSGMFYKCTSLVNAPKLPAKKLADECYADMFKKCTSLVTAPEISATELANECCSYMFNGCTSLLNAPKLSAKVMKSYCYQHMFENCEALEEAPELNSTNVEDSCYRGMFIGCKSLKKAPALPAETLADDCYAYMFSYCTALKSSPALSATTMADRCCYQMFYKCTALEASPALPATTIANRECCFQMFEGCSNLTSIGMIGDGKPVEANNLSMTCMFEYCTKLNVSESTDDSDANRFITVKSADGNSTRDMFYGCAASAYIQGGKSYKFN